MASIERVLAIMLEESAEIAEQARAARHKLLTDADKIYWLERAGENMRRYAEWIEKAVGAAAQPEQPSQANP